MSNAREIASAAEPGRETLRARNLRTGLVLVSIALVFFVGVILQYALRST